ncbi:MAG TPA: cyclopropane-fatty-acyl-phospholipid synthase family protein [Gemmatimonadota bacterium]|nr:cyclopropane-fatty-acyl-phospholipid synthase family protein [Gemmatimonadota bacterium]
MSVRIGPHPALDVAGGGGRAPSRLDRLAMRGVARGLEGLGEGRLEFLLPDGRTLALGRGRPGDAPGGAWRPGAAPLPVRITVHDWSFFRRVLLEGGTGAGGAYIDGLWSCDDLVALIGLVAERGLRLEDTVPLTRLGGLANRVAHRVRRNTVRRARGNIAAHYDLGNDFYALWLDPSMTYSCAVFEHPGQTLEAAQRNKYRTIAEKARLRPGQRVLEIGCGWGGFMEYAASAHGCHVTGITLSAPQASYARDRLRRAGLEERAKIEIVDYRRIEGKFDRIVSIEMLEAVGHEYLGDFFAACDRALAPDGLAAVQVITIPDARYEDYRRGVDYTQRYIFPGSHLPSLGALAAALAATTLQLEDLENIGVHYAETLRRWRIRFLEQAARVRDLGFEDRFLRRWEYYLAYCEAGFLTRHLNDLQLVLTRAGNPDLPPGPRARD